MAVTAVADEHGSVTDEQGLDVASLLATPPDGPVAADVAGDALVGSRDAVLSAPVDVLVLAACEDAMSIAHAGAVRALAVAVGANLGLRGPVEELLHRRGIAVVPDVVAGCGGSASMDALFGPPRCPDAQHVLSRTGMLLEEVVHEVLGRSRSAGITSRAAAVELAGLRAPAGPGRPYGRRAPFALGRS